MRRGEIHWVNLPLPNQSSPTKVQQGRRPAVILQADDRRTVVLGSRNLPLPTLVIAPLTTNLKGRNFPGSVLVHPSATNGLTADSVVLLTSLTAVDVSSIVEKVGILDAADLQRVQTELSRFLAL